MIKESILFIGISQSLFAALVLGTRRKISVSDLILIGCLLAITLRFLTKILISYTPDYPITDISAGIIPLTFGPFLYLYTKYLTNGDPSFAKKDWLHFIPFIVFLFVCFVLFGGQISFNEVQFFANDRFLWIRVIFGLVFFSSVLIYMIFTFILLANYRQSISLDLDQATGDKNLFWLNFVSFLFSALIVSYIVIGGINALTFSGKFDLDLISNIGLIVLVYAVSYFGIKQPSILENVYSKSLRDSHQKGNESNGSKSKYARNDSEKLSTALQAYMDTEKPYLRTDLSLADLASTLDVSKSELTYLLNNYIGVNFFSYVNQYRLKIVLQKLEDSKFNHLTILSIAFDCGFNSKSTFNSLFKQHTGVTPSEYRQNQSSQRSNK
jgi:AraC-like DNA-binding protein